MNFTVAEHSGGVLMRKAILILIFLILPIIIEFADISYGSVVPLTSHQLRVLAFKESILTPDEQIWDDGKFGRYGTGHKIIYDDDFPIDYNFIEEMTYEKHYIRDLYVLKD